MADNNKSEQLLSPRSEEKKHKDKKKDKGSSRAKRTPSSSNVNEKTETPRGNVEAKETKEPIAPSQDTPSAHLPAEDVTEYLNDPKLQTGIKHKLVRKGNTINRIQLIAQLIYRRRFCAYFQVIFLLVFLKQIALLNLSRFTRTEPKVTFLLISGL